MASKSGDQRLAMAALEKQRRGAKPTREEASALRRYEAAIDESKRIEAYASVPKKFWRTWSGRQDKILLEQADRYEFPMLRGAAISLPEFVRRFHDFLAEHARQLAGPETDDPTLAGMASPALERKRQIDCQRLELRLRQEEGQLLARRVVHDAHNRIGGILRVAGEALQRQFGEAAQKILNDALDNCRREVDRLLDADGGNLDPESGSAS